MVGRVSASRVSPVAKHPARQQNDLDPGVNRAIFSQAYTPEQLDTVPSTAFDRALFDLRHELVARHGHGRDVLDIGCGSGYYLLPHLSQVRSAVGIDFSPIMLDSIRRRLGDPLPQCLTLFEADARAIPVADASIDLAFSFTTLYYVPDVERVVAEVERVLRPGGYAALELGAQWSLNTIVSHLQHRDAGSARPNHVPYGRLVRMMRDSGLEVSQWRSFQLVPMYGAPRRLRLLAPLFSPRLKRFAGLRVRGRILDERLASLPVLRRVAFRHMVIARKP